MRALLLLVPLLFMLLPTGCGNLGDLGTYETDDPADTDDPVGSPDCGNGERDPGEECDGSDFGGQTCVTFGHTSGSLDCTDNCRIDDDSCFDTPTVPPEWTCPDSLFATGGGCDCGCGAVDPDCSSQAVASCDQCDASGSCAVDGYDCPADIDPYNNAVCSPAVCGDDVITAPEVCDGYEVGALSCTDYGFAGGTLTCNDSCDDVDTSVCNGGSVPGSWTCDAGYYGTFDGCDCGCGAFDPDCGDATVSSCDWCTDTGSCAGSCADIDPVDNSICSTGGGGPVCGNGTAESGEVCDGSDLNGNDCTDVGAFTGGVLGCNSSCDGFITSSCTTSGGGGPPGSWTCSSLWWSDGSCDCGCGAFDVDDCADATVGSCDWCDDTGSCSTGSGCPGTIDPVDNSTCTTGGGTGSTPSSAGDLIVTELMPDPDMLPDSDGEWFEIHNPTSSSFDLDNCEFRSDPSNLLAAGSVTIAAGGYATWGASAAPGFSPGRTYSTGTFSLRNSDDTFEIWCDGTQIDAVAYDSGTGWPVEKGKSISLDSGSLTHTANDSAGNWCVGTASYNGDFGSPGAANPLCP